MACDFARDQLSAYHDGQLDARGKATVETHLAQCADCRRELEEVRSASRLVQSLGRAQAPEWLAKNIQDEIARSAAPPRVVTFRRYVEAALACAAGILLVMSVVHLASGPAERRGTPAPDMAMPKPPESKEEKGFVQKNAPVPSEPSVKALKEDKEESGRKLAEADKSSRCMLVFTENDSAVRRLFESQMTNMGAQWSSKEMYIEAELTADEAQALVRKLQEAKATCSEEPVVASAHDSLVKLQNDCWGNYRARENHKELAKKTEDSKKAGGVGGTPTPSAKAQAEQYQGRSDPSKKDAPTETPAQPPSSKPAEDKVVQEKEAEKPKAPELRRSERAKKPVERWRFYIMPKDGEALRGMDRLRRELQAPAEKEK